MIELIDNFGLQCFFGSDSMFLDHFALAITNSWLWLPMYIALLILIVKNNDNVQTITLCFACAVVGILVATGMTTMVTKPLVERLRPCNEPMVKYMAQIAGNLHNKDYSFFSSHAATSMSLVLYFSLLVRSRLLTVTLSLWSLCFAWSRLYLGQHYLTDVMVGMVWGACSGAMAYALYKRLGCRMGIRRNFISSQYTPTGYAICDVDVVASVVALLFTFAVFCF